MATRDPALQNLIDPLLAGLSVRAGAWSGGQHALTRAADALATTGAVPAAAGARLPVPPAVGQTLAPALTIAQAAGGHSAAVARALENLMPQITWYARQDGEGACEGFAHRHALATLIGPTDRAGVLEIRDDVRVGISLVSPETP